MKKNKLLIIIILLGFLTFGMTYSGLIKENFVTPLVKQLTDSKKSSVTKIAESKNNLLTTKKTNANAAAATISVTNAVAVNGGGTAVPGSQLDFTITINNSGIDDAAGTTFQDILDSNLTFVPGSLKVTPIAVNDSYNCIGNVGITVNAAGGVLTNDVSPDATALTVAVLANPANGTVSLASNGSFTYNSNAGYSGTDTFTYTLTSTNGKTDTATVSIIVSAPIFFVNSTVAANGNGTLSSPFKTVDNVTGTGSNPIFIYSGASGTSLTLSNNQKVIGQGATTSLISLLGVTVPTYSNTLPSTGGANPTFAVLNLKLNNDVEGITLSGTNATMAGASVGTLKVRDVSIIGGSAIPVNIAAGGGAIDCIFKSISANGASKGISVSNSTGSFQVTGNGTTAGSGGTIQNIANRGAEFISCTNVTLKNMNFTNSTTSTAVCSTPASDNSSCNGAIHLKTVTGVILDNISITGTNNATGININNVTNFTLTNSTLTGCGSNTPNSEVGGIYALNLGGTCSITNTLVNDSWGRGFSAYNGILSSNPTLVLTVTGSQFKNSFNKANGGSNFNFEGYGSSNNTLTLKGNDFSNPKEYGLTLNFGNTSTNNIQVGGNLIADGNVINAAASSPGSNGLSLQAVGAATVNYNVINNTLKSSFNGAFTCNVGNQGTGTMKGRINNNTIDGGGIGSSCNGISVAAYGSGKHITEILNNTITNITNYGIVSEANDNNATGTARMDATIKNNNINLVTNAYAHVSVIAISNDVTATSTLKSVANIANNTTNSPVTGLAAGTFDVLSLGTNSQVILQGATALANGTGDRTTALTAFWNANNTGTRTAIDEVGGGTIISGTALVPDNPSASKFVTPKIEEELAAVTGTQNTNENSNVSSAKNITSKTTSGETISVGPFTLAAGKSTTITFSATVNAAGTLPVNTCTVTNQATVSGSNFTTVNSNITTTSIKPANATFTNTTENIPCLGTATVNLSATCPLGTTATWYTSLSGGSSFATGTSVTATPTTNNTTYCVACEAAYCASDRLLVKTVTGTPSTASSQTVSACDSYTWSENGTTYTTSGTYTNVVGCDTKTLNLTISNSSAINSAVTVNSGLLTASQSGATYQWYQCPNTLLTNETNQSYTALANGDYKVEITMGDCTVISNCVTVSNLAVGEFKQNEFKIYPNPNNGIVNIVTPYQGNYILLDLSGKTLKSFNLDENIVTALNLENLSDGTYFIKNNSNNKIKTQKLIIKK